MSEVLVRYMHFLGIISLGSALVSQHILLNIPADAKKLKRLAIVDAWFGISALVVLTAGLLLWFVVGKPADFYSQNWIFHLKVTVFFLIGLLSIYPTLFFVRNRNKDAFSVAIPKSVIIVNRIELTLLVAMPLFATLMAHGYGLR